ncbi:hypothetical protein AVEN_47413-1 [Araneus ventricosus]|uniref:Uncharacterized protein n=1 Tax=Araneus ventricosus TaxID=182803 RepID=A0A4Y2IU51_ARAVE|nr:hypothetical protein AVEN_47413-1 [Araneus ventricosus]
MPFGPVNPIDTPYGQFVYDYTHPRKPLCFVSFGQGQDNLTEARTDVPLREHGFHFLPRIPIQLTGLPLGSELGVIQSGDDPGFF